MQMSYSDQLVGRPGQAMGQIQMSDGSDNKISVEDLKAEVEQAMANVLSSKEVLSQAQSEFDRVVTPMKQKLTAIEQNHKRNHTILDTAMARLKARL